jgi:hypothetical protein
VTAAEKPNSTPSLCPPSWEGCSVGAKGVRKSIGAASRRRQRLTMEAAAAHFVRRGEMKKTIRWLRRNSADAASASDGNTLLHLSIIHKQPELVRELICRGATVDVPNHNGSTALMTAAQLGRKMEARLLLDNGADTNRQTPQGATALMAAAVHNQHELMALLLSASAKLDTQTMGGETALMAAAAAGADACVRLLLNWGANVMLRNHKGWTALECAEMQGHVSTQLLLKTQSVEAPASPIRPGAVRLKLSDGQVVTVLESALQTAPSSTACPCPQDFRSKTRTTSRHYMLTKAMCE